MRLILVRHGETEHNRGRLTLGRFDVPMNGRGRAQARALASSFARPPDAMYTSPLSRAAETAAIIAGAAGCRVEIEPALIEMDVGEMEHLSREELRLRYPDFLERWLSEGAADARMPGGETLRQVQDRAWGAVGVMLEAHPHGRVVAVTHNFVILTLICRALELPLSEFRRLRQGLAARTIVDIGTGHTTLLQLNDNAHLLAAGLGDDAVDSAARL
ncbi:MAG: histidine phosphatase family protein [Chloroflexota bacterium]|nr:histidine phosphatase family protein [Chloroflexota bacterium]